MSEAMARGDHSASMKRKRRLQIFMLDRKSSSWFYPKTTGDPGRDRNVRTMQFSCFLLALAVGAVLIVSAISRDWQETPLLVV
jgi:hypothetical protein